MDKSRTSKPNEIQTKDNASDSSTDHQSTNPHQRTAPTTSGPQSTRQKQMAEWWMSRRQEEMKQWWANSATIPKAQRKRLGIRQRHITKRIKELQRQSGRFKVPQKTQAEGSGAPITAQNSAEKKLSASLRKIRGILKYDKSARSLRQMVPPSATTKAHTSTDTNHAPAQTAPTPRQSKSRRARRKTSKEAVKLNSKQQRESSRFIPQPRLDGPSTHGAKPAFEQAANVLDEAPVTKRAQNKTAHARFANRVRNGSTTAQRRVGRDIYTRHINQMLKNIFPFFMNDISYQSFMDDVKAKDAVKAEKRARLKSLDKSSLTESQTRLLKTKARTPQQQLKAAAEGAGNAFSHLSHALTFMLILKLDIEAFLASPPITESRRHKQQNMTHLNQMLKHLEECIKIYEGVVDDLLTPYLETLIMEIEAVVADKRRRIDALEQILREKGNFTEEERQQHEKLSAFLTNPRQPLFDKLTAALIGGPRQYMDCSEKMRHEAGITHPKSDQYANVARKLTNLDLASKARSLTASMVCNNIPSLIGLEPLAFFLQKIVASLAIAFPLADDPEISRPTARSRFTARKSKTTENTDDAAAPDPDGALDPDAAANSDSDLDAARAKSSKFIPG